MRQNAIWIYGIIKSAENTEKKQLGKLIKDALQNGELIITIDKKVDSRKYEGEAALNIQEMIDSNKTVVVLKEKETGRNELFLDLLTAQIMDRENFVELIQARKYPGYTVANMNELAMPMSKPDNNIANNLG